MSLLRGLTACALLAALLVPPPTSAQTAAPDRSVLATIEAQVSQIRGLPARAEVPLQVLDKTGLHQYLTDAFERDYLPDEREADQKELVALGLIRPNDNLAQIQLDLLQGQVIGVYDPDDKLMFVLDSQSVFGPAERLTYAHEFNHALQDQYFDLDTVAPRHPVSNDRSLAAHAVVEGDAVLLQTLWAAANLTPDELLGVSQASTSGDDALARAPLVVRTELLFPYVEGFNFVRRAFREGGDGFARVDEFLRHPPESTAQILHPERFWSGWRPVDVDLPDVAETLGSGWRRVGSGVLGELDVRVLLEQYGDRADARRVAAGWSGDRWLLLEQDGHSTIVLRTTWDSESAARAFFKAYKHGLQTRFDQALAEDDSDIRHALTTAVAATDLRVQGRDVVAVIAPDRTAADAVVGALTTTVLERSSAQR